MLISLSKRFIFVATLKTASTSIESALSQFSEIKLQKSEWGKHFGLADIERSFSWVFDRIPFEDFTTFGVIRDPIDFSLSLYNFHRGPGFARFEDLYTGDLTMDAFLTKWMEKNEDQARPQTSRFISRTGKISMTYIINYDKLSKQFTELTEALKLPTISLAVENASPRGVTVGDLNADIISAIKEKYRDDLNTITELSGRWLAKPRF